MRSMILLLAGLCACATRSPDARATEPAGDLRNEPTACRDAAVAIEVLGSGGPILDDDRGSAGYVVWVDGSARLIVDLGPGAMSAFGAAGGTVDELDAVLLSHLHVDHSADLAALGKSAWFGGRTKALPIVGPAEAGAFPSTTGFVQGMFGADGIYRYLSGYTEGGKPFAMRPRDVALDGAEPTEVLRTQELTVRALGVPHGPVPALAFVVEVDGFSVGFMGDQRADEERYVSMMRDVDVLVAHMAVSDGPDPVAGALHATPERLGIVAAEAGVERLVLSHLMPRTLANLDANVESIGRAFEGEVVVAYDGLCVEASGVGS